MIRTFISFLLDHAAGIRSDDLQKLELQLLPGATASKGTYIPKVVVISVTGGESVNGGVDDRVGSRLVEARER
jgi:hypothetical protein